MPSSRFATRVAIPVVHRLANQAAALLILLAVANRLLLVAVAVALLLAADAKSLLLAATPAAAVVLRSADC